MKRLLILILALVCLTGCAAKQEAPAQGNANVNIANGGWALASGNELYLSNGTKSAVVIRNGRPVELGFAGMYFNDAGDQIIFQHGEDMKIASYNKRNGKVTISGILASVVLTVGDYVYYANDEGCYRVLISDLAKEEPTLEQMHTSPCMSIQRVEERIWVVTDYASLWSMDQDGQNLERSKYYLEDPYGSAHITDQGVFAYVPTAEAGKGIYRLEADGEVTLVQAGEFSSSFIVTDSSIYAINADSELCRIPIEGGDAEVVAKDCAPALQMDGNDLLYRSKNDQAIYRLTPDGETTCIYSPI